MSPAESKKQFLDSSLTLDILAGLFRRLPVFDKKTEGFWIDENNEPRHIISGRHDVEYVAAQEYWRTVAQALKPGSAWNSNLFVNDHLEIKAAIQMFVDQREHGTIVINNPNGPCDGGPWACKEVLAKYLCRGQTLTMSWPEGNHIIKGMS